MAAQKSLRIVPVPWIGLGIAVVFTVIFYFLFFVLILKNVPILRDSWLARVLADAQHINLGSYLAFSIAIVLLVSRYITIKLQTRWLNKDNLLPTDEQVLLPDDCLELRRSVRDLSPRASRSIPIQLLDAGLQQSRISWSPESVSDAIKTRAETIHGQIEAEYGMIKFLIWAIPSIGFCGTVFGLGDAIGAMRNVPGQEISQDEQMQQAIGSLFTAFDTTLVALVLSIVVMFLFHWVQSREDSFVVNSLDWSIRDLALRLHSGE